MVDRGCRGRGVDWDRVPVRRVPIPIERARLKKDSSVNTVEITEMFINRT